MFTVQEIIKVTGAILVSGDKQRPVKGISIDSRTFKRNEAFIAIKGERFDGHAFIANVVKSEPAAIIISKKEPEFNPPENIPVLQVRNTREALGRIAAFHRNRFNIPVIGITGSAGKTTTKELISYILSAKFKVLKNEGTENNLVGVSLALLNLRKRHEVAVIELGTNYFGEIENLSRITRPNIGIITNIGPAHLAQFKSLDGVLREKETLIKNLIHPAVSILNSDDPMLQPILSGRKGRRRSFSFGVNNPADMNVSSLDIKDNRLKFSIKSRYNMQLSTPGEHNIYNAICAILAVRFFGIDYVTIKRRMRGFKFPTGRLNLIRRSDFILMDDSYNANPLSVKKALLTLSNFRTRGRKIFIMGDMFELGQDREELHKALAPKIKGSCDIFISVGTLSRLTAEELKGAGFDKNNLFICRNSLQAKDTLLNCVCPGRNDIVLIKGSRSMQIEKVLS